MSMSDETLFLGPSEAFLTGLTVGEFDERRNAAGRLSPIYRSVFGHLYEVPGFYDTLRNRFDTFVPAMGFITGKRGPEPAGVRWTTIGDCQFAASPAEPLTIFSRASREAETVNVLSRRLHPGARKSLLDQIVHRLRGFLALPWDLAVLHEVAGSEELAGDWARVARMLASGELFAEVPLRQDSPKRIEVTLARLLPEYPSEVEAGRCFGRLLAAFDLLKAELDELRQSAIDGESLFDEFDEGPQGIEEEVVERFTELVRIGTPEALAEIRRMDNDRPALEEERPSLDCGEKLRRAVESLVELPVVRNVSHAASAVERLRKRPFDLSFVWDNGLNPSPAQVDFERRRGSTHDRTWHPGSYGDKEMSVEEYEELAQELTRSRELVWTAIGALLGDMADRDRAFSEEDSERVVPRAFSAFSIDDAGRLREFLPTMRRLLAAGQTSRGGDKAAVVKTLATSLQPILESAFPDRFSGRDDGVPDRLRGIFSDPTRTDDEKCLAGAMNFLWHNYRLSAAHRGAERRYTFGDARVVYALYELAVELHDRIVQSRRSASGTP